MKRPEWVLRQARQLLVSDGWHQGSYRGPAGRRDVVMALADALGAGRQHHLADLVEILHRHLPASVTSLPSWNDQPWRTQDEVLGLLDAAADDVERNP